MNYTTLLMDAPFPVYKTIKGDDVIYRAFLSDRDLITSEDLEEAFTEAEKKISYLYKLEGETTTMERLRIKRLLNEFKEVYGY